MKKTFIFIILIFVFNINSFAIKGSGVIASEKREVSKFHSIKLKCNAKVNITQGSTQIVIIKSDDNILPLIKTKVDAGELSINIVGFAAKITSIEIDIVMEDINQLIVNGPGSINGLTLFEIENIKLIVNGAGSIDVDLKTEYVFSKVFGTGTIYVSGSTINHEIDLASGGTLNSESLISDKADIIINISGIANINAVEEIKIRITGSGDISYYGSPKINANFSGTGTIIPLE